MKWFFAVFLLMYNVVIPISKYNKYIYMSIY